jgi:DNA polymerase-1
MVNKVRANFVIIDANAIVHSAFHGYSPCLDKKNQDQRVLYGIMDTLVNLTFQIPNIDYLYIVFDPDDGSLYRKSMFPLYKANRPPKDPELSRQRDVAKKVIEDHLGIPTITYPGYEADDIIGTLSNLASNEYNVIIVSPDKDLMQLVKPNVMLLRKIRTKYERGYKSFNENQVYEQFGVQPIQIPDWIALVGDVADNLPGLNQIGDKKASKLLKIYPTIEHMIAVVHEMENEKLKIQIVDNKENLLLVKKLATIICDLPLEDKTQLAMIKAQKIRSHNEYKKKLMTIKNHFDWPIHFLNMFID